MSELRNQLYRLLHTREKELAMKEYDIHAAIRKVESLQKEYGKIVENISEIKRHIERVEAEE